MKNIALVVIDLQNDITKNYREIIARVNQAVDWAAASGMYVVYIQNQNLSAGTRTFKPGTHGAELVPEMKIASDHIFIKTKSNALTSEDFATFIQENAITEFFIAGADATACVKSTCFNMKKKRLHCPRDFRLHHKLQQKQDSRNARLLRKQRLRRKSF